MNRFQNDSVHFTFGGGMTRILFRSFWNWNVTQKNASCFSSVCSHSGIVPKECTLDLDKRALDTDLLTRFLEHTIVSRGIEADRVNGYRNVTPPKNSMSEPWHCETTW